MATIRNQLSYGSQGSDVTELQKLLNQNGYNLAEDGIFGDNTKNAVEDYQKKNNLSVDGIVGTNTWGALNGNATNKSTNTSNTANTATTEAANTGFQYGDYKQSDAVQQAQALLQQQMANKPGAYNSQWQGQLDDVIGQILNRDKFSYDLNADALYQQYANQYINQGRMAMMDTMGQAAQLTGGYGNSYAQSVGQQAYQGYLQQLNDKIPDLYQLALQKYQMEGDALYDQYAMLGAQEEQDYGRYRDEMSDYAIELERLQNQYNAERDYDYGQWVDGRDFAYGQYSDDRAYDYQAGRDQVADSQWQAEFDEAVRQFNFANKLGEFDPNANSGSGSSGSGGSGGSGGGSGSSGSKWLNSDGTVNVDAINTNTEWWQNYAAANGLDPNTGKHASSGGGGGGDGTDGGTGGWTEEIDTSGWNAGQWESYFAQIRQTEGTAAAQQELNQMTSSGEIPKKYVASAASGARGGKMGH